MAADRGDRALRPHRPLRRAGGVEPGRARLRREAVPGARPPDPGHGRARRHAAIGAARRGHRLAPGSSPTLDGLLDKGEPIACVVVDLEHVAVAQRDATATTRSNDFCECIEQRLRDFDPAIERARAVGPGDIRGVVVVAPMIAAPSQAARALSPRVVGAGRARRAADAGRGPHRRRASRRPARAPIRCSTSPRVPPARRGTARCRSSCTTATSDDTARDAARARWPTPRPRSTAAISTSRTSRSATSRTALRRRRGAGPLAAPGTGRHSAVGVRPARRANGPRRRARQVRAADRVHRPGAAAARPGVVGRCACR